MTGDSWSPGKGDLTSRSGVEFGDRVRVRSTPITVRAGIAGRVGQVHGHTTPSLGYVPEIVGEPGDDVAVNVQFDDTAVWIASDLIEFVDHSAGMTIGIGDVQMIREPDGSWTQLGSDRKGRSQ